MGCPFGGLPTTGRPEVLLGAGAKSYTAAPQWFSLSMQQGKRSGWVVKDIRDFILSHSFHGPVLFAQQLIKWTNPTHVFWQEIERTGPRPRLTIRIWAYQLKYPHYSTKFWNWPTSFPLLLRVAHTQAKKITLDHYTQSWGLRLWPSFNYPNRLSRPL